MGIMVGEVYGRCHATGEAAPLKPSVANAAAEAVPASLSSWRPGADQAEVKADLKAELATAVNRMLLAQLAVAGSCSLPLSSFSTRAVECPTSPVGLHSRTGTWPSINRNAGIECWCASKPGRPLALLSGLW